MSVDQVGLSPVPMTELPPITLGRLTLNATDAAGVQWVVEKIEGWDSPDVRALSEDRAGDHGARIGATFFGRRVLTLTGWHVAPDRDTRDAADDYLAASVPLTDVLVTKAAQRVTGRRLDPLKIEEINPESSRWSVMLTAADPRKYADTESSVMLSLPAASGGLVWPLSWPLAWGAATSGSATATNAGTFPTRPVVRFNGPLTRPKIENSTAGRAVEVDVTLAAGEYLEVDMDARTVLLNGSASRAGSLLRREWFELAPGDSVLRLGAAGGSGTATVRWRSAWI